MKDQLQQSKHGNKKMQCQVWEQQKHQLMGCAVNWQQQKKKVGSKSKWEKQWGCFLEDGSFPASTKKAPTGKQLQNKSICWEHFLLHPEDPPCHQFLKATKVHPQCSAQGATSNGTAPSRSHVELTHPGPVPAGSLQGSAPVCELPLNHLLISRLQPSYVCEALQLWHQTHLPHGGKLSSPCPAARLANDRHLLFLLFLQHPFSQFSFLPPRFQLVLIPALGWAPSPDTAAPCFLQYHHLGGETLPQL